MPRGCFIVFEGIDGSGKSEQFRRLSANLEKRKYRVVKTKEPTVNQPIGMLIRQVLFGNEELKQMPEESLALLFAADRVDHLKTKIMPALEEGSVVVSDRYVYSSYAYQSRGMRKELDLEWLFSLNRYAVEPDIVVFLDISPELSQKRLKDGQKRVQDHTYFETEAQQEKIRSVYYQVFNLQKPMSSLDDYSEGGRKGSDDYMVMKLNDATLVRVDGALSKKKIEKIVLDNVLRHLEEKKVPKIDGKSLKAKSLTVFS